MVKYGDSTVYYSRIGDCHLRYPGKLRRADVARSVIQLVSNPRLFSRIASHDVASNIVWHYNLGGLLKKLKSDVLARGKNNAGRDSHSFTLELNLSNSSTHS
jgi:hypothetical protein